jgi:hypothetical protein
MSWTVGWTHGTGSKRVALPATRKYEAKGSMDAPQEEFYSKPETEVWIAFDCRGPGAKNRLHRERRAWGSCATVEGCRQPHAGGALSHRRNHPRRFRREPR